MSKITYPDPKKYLPEIVLNSTHVYVENDPTIWILTGVVQKGTSWSAQEKGKKEMCVIYLDEIEAIEAPPIEKAVKQETEELVKKTEEKQLSSTKFARRPLDQDKFNALQQELKEAEELVLKEVEDDSIEKLEQTLEQSTKEVNQKEEEQPVSAPTNSSDPKPKKKDTEEINLNQFFGDKTNKLEKFKQLSKTTPANTQSSEPEESNLNTSEKKLLLMLLELGYNKLVEKLK